MLAGMLTWLCRTGWVIGVILLLAGSRHAHAVKVLPRETVLVGGESCGFAVQIQGPSAAWQWALLEAKRSECGEVKPATGIYQAPLVEEVKVFHLRASHPHDPAIFGDATITVLPREPFVRPWKGSLESYPFLIPGTHRRFGKNEVVHAWSPAKQPTPSGFLVTGYNQPVTLRWESPAGTEAAILSYREGDQVRFQDVTGLESTTLCLKGSVADCKVEALTHAQGRCTASTWKSFERHFNLGLRGTVPFAGRPDVAGYADGSGAEALFREPVGIALLGGGLHCPAGFIVADASSHTLRAVSSKGEADGGWGKDGEPGHRDGSPSEARFHRPAFVAVNRWFKERQPYQYSKAFAVSDSGNHVIRWVDAEGRVSTLAGRPGQAGHRDSERSGEALFDTPQGLVMDEGGDIFVADQGNHVIRKISKQGQVSTLAGQAGERGVQDGTGPQARFSHTMGLAQAGDGNLYVADGHAIRRITKSGVVTTVVGAPDRPGFQDNRGQGEALAGTPCLRDPSGVQAVWKRLFVADSGNHAVREYDLTAGTLKTLVGDPAEAQIRMGLLRDGLEGPLERGYAALAFPRALALCERGDLYVSTGASLVMICRQERVCDRASIPELRVAQMGNGPGEPLQVSFAVPKSTEGQGEGRSFRYTVDFLNEDGTLSARQEGSGLENQWLTCEGAFSRPGLGIRAHAFSE